MRTERVKEYTWIKKNYQVSDFCYRLPSREEWELCSNNGSNVSWNKQARNEKGQAEINCVSTDTTALKKGYMRDNADVTAPVYAYFKNRFGIYNMIGNVAEMVSEKGISKGGSWRNRLEECRPGKDLAYTQPEAWLGFRCACVVRR